MKQDFPLSDSSRRIGVFDLGSNSIKFLLADREENKLTVLKDASSITRLGEGVQETGMLSQDAMERTLDALASFYAGCDSHPPIEWRAAATSAVRASANRETFRTKFRERMKFDLQILSGEEEAELIYQGVTSDNLFTSAQVPLMVIDSGGGSCEFISGSSQKIEKRISLELGCVRMTERFLEGDPYTLESLQALQDYFQNQLKPLLENFSAIGRTVIGTGGSLSTAGALIQKTSSYEKDSLHGMEIQKEQLEFLFQKLSQSTNEVRIQEWGIPPKRADVITAGVMFFTTAMTLFKIPVLRLGLRGLRYGLLFRNPDFSKPVGLP